MIKTDSKLTVVVLAHNEASNIARCLDSLQWCPNILLIDDGSTDQTLAIARKYPVKVFIHSLNADFSAQRNYALTLVTTEWTLFVDADEVVSENLAREIDRVICQSDNTGYFLKRIDWFAGRWLKHGEISSIRLLRLAMTTAGHFVRPVDEVWQVKGKVGTLTSPLRHYSHPDLTSFLQSINDRSTLNAQFLYKEGRQTTFVDWFKPIAKFISNYFLRLGFLDGTAGFVFAVCMSLHSFLVRGKLYVLIKKKRLQQSSITAILLAIWVGLVTALFLYQVVERGLSKW